MKLSIIIPVYNEEKYIVHVVNEVKKLNIPKEIIIVDDASTDNSRKIISGLKGIHKIFHTKNRGKGAAIASALKFATGDYIIMQDADLEYRPSDIISLVDKAITEKADAVYGSRFLKKHKPRYVLNYLGNKLINIFITLFFNSKITDAETCYKLVRKTVVNQLNIRAKRFDFEIEITTKLLKRGYKIFEVPIRYKCRSYKAGKKIRWTDGVIALAKIFYYRFS